MAQMTDRVKLKEGNALIVEVDNLEVHVIRTDEGVVADIWPAAQDAEESLAGTYAYFNEADPLDDDDPGPGR